MPSPRRLPVLSLSFGWFLSVFLLSVLAPSEARSAEIDFSRQVRPILAQYCFKCHGPDDLQRQAGLRLDQREAAVAPAESGARAIVPGQAAASELLRRIDSTDDDQIMPPPATKKKLTNEERAILRQWVAEGARYQPHWSFSPPQQAAPPVVQQRPWPLVPFDPYVLAKLEQRQWSPNPVADRYTLARRLSLDLLGLPPTPAAADDFVADQEPDAYERLVDRLLASPSYGERWARRWLDLARYADTNGYEKDRPRSIWPYRDWVIQALNADLPFDQFSIEQLAGDMLPGASEAQRIATGFHRNTMMNEEGGVDPLEFRFHAMTDRVSTTGTIWLGLTLGCAHCHTHKFDPIPHAEYYGLFAMLNNADEPELEVRRPDLLERRRQLTPEIERLEAELPSQFPPAGEWRWSNVKVVKATAASGATLQPQEDGSYLVTGPAADVDTYTIELETELPEIAALRLETLTHASLGKNGPGRTAHGNFVLTELELRVAPGTAKAENMPESAPKQAPQPVKIATAKADIEQDMFPVAHAFDGNAKTGWAIHNTAQPLNQNRAATFTFEQPTSIAGPTRWTVVIKQDFGSQHTIGRFRLQFGQMNKDGRPLAERRQEHLQRQFSQWTEQQAARAVKWQTLRPTTARSNLPLLTILPDDSILASGDQSKSDRYDLTFADVPRGITAIRVTALPDERLPKYGPGRVFYEGPMGDFFLSDIRLSAGPRSTAADGAAAELTVFPFAKATQSFASGGNTAAAAIDDNKQTGWSINGGQGKSHTAVFTLREPLTETGTLALSLLFERFYAAGLGRLRIDVTTDARAEATSLSPEVERALALPAAERTKEDEALLLKAFVAVAPELAPARQRIEQLRSQLPAFPTTLVLQERPPENPRPTFRHHRGEFLQPKERIEPRGLSILPPLPSDSAPNRLTFAQWLVAANNPLVGRVTMNRRWAALFGRGLVRTTEDFGYQGESPTNQELLDWLAVELTRQNWSLKRMDRLIVTSATYRQSSRVTPERFAQDPQNELLSRGARARLEAELIRDSLLQMSGLLTQRLGGASVFPPQPANVTTEGAYGQLSWQTSSGGDRYRRGLYTFAKRTAPYAMFTTFDAPSGEACVARRESSNTPLQALTLMNDVVFLETAQALGADVLREPLDDTARAISLFRRCVTRPPTAEELQLVLRFQEQQRQRFASGQLDPAPLAGAGAGTGAGTGAGDVAVRAAWIATARAILNLDETITKN
ncbi:MAG: PSD1 and planctomycete cytochrome C domain-containing protein [Planctomycetota bacterium]